MRYGCVPGAGTYHFRSIQITMSRLLSLVKESLSSTNPNLLISIITIIDLFMLQS